MDLSSRLSALQDITWWERNTKYKGEFGENDEDEKWTDGSQHNENYFTFCSNFGTKNAFCGTYFCTLVVLLFKMFSHFEIKIFNEKYEILFWQQKIKGVIWLNKKF